MRASSVGISAPAVVHPAGASPAALERRAELASALSALARLALGTLGSADLFEAVARSLAQTLGVEHAAVIECPDDPRAAAVMLAGHGWPVGTPWSAASEGGTAPVAGAFSGEQAVALVPACWRSLDSSRAAVAVAAPGAGASSVMIAALGSGDAGFELEELAFVETVAEVLAAALRRSTGEAHSRHAAKHDALTGVANRAQFSDRLEDAISRAAGSGGTVAVLNLDLDRFSVVNETLGSGLGDELLIAVTERLLAVLDEGQSLARIDGDEFAILVEGFAGERGAIELADELLRALEPPVELDERDVFTGASIGIAVATGRGAGAESLLSDAQVALRRAKQQRRGRYEVFDQTMRRRIRERLDLERDLRRALDRGEFELHYQPIVSLEEQRIVGLESLVRWSHPQRGLVAPGAFIGLAEETGLIIPLGRWVLQEACRQLARWSADPEIDVPYVSVNLSGRQLAQADLPQEIAELLHVTGVAPERLALELTESVLMEETDSPTAVVERLKGLGVRILLDDFGTGYSSLNYVKRFPVEAIKIDRSFVSGVADDESDRHILRAIVSMAAGFGVELVAEGVETFDQARWLRHLGVTLVQGYGFGRPAPVPATEILLRQGLPLDRLREGFTRLDLDADTAGRRVAARVEEREPTMSVGEAAAALELSPSTLRRWAESGRIAMLRTRGGHRRFAVREVQRLSAAKAPLRKPTVRVFPTPVEPLPDLERLLDAAAPRLATAAAHALYDSGYSGWFASPSGRGNVERWALAVARGAGTGHYELASEATRKLILQASAAGASLLERHTMLERLGEMIARELEAAGMERSRLLAARRLLVRLRQLGLEPSSA